MGKAFRTEKQVKILKLALEIYNDVEKREETSFFFGKNTGMCSCINAAIKEICGVDIPYDQIKEYIPRFNFDSLYSKGLAGIIPQMKETRTKCGFWWDNENYTIRPIVFQYLIDSYKK